MPHLSHLAADLLCRRADPSRFPFETTADLEDFPGVVGQDRAVVAIRFGIGIRRSGYNLFGLGPPATGKHTIVREFVERQAASEPAPSDWCYVNTTSYRPRSPLRSSCPPARLRNFATTSAG